MAGIFDPAIFDSAIFDTGEDTSTRRDTIEKGPMRPYNIRKSKR